MSASNTPSRPRGATTTADGDATTRMTAVTDAPRPAAAETSAETPAPSPAPPAARPPAETSPAAATDATDAPEPAGTETAGAVLAGTRTQVRRARLVLTRVDPWSVMKLTFLLSVAAGIAVLVAVAVVWNVLNGMGVFSSVSSTIEGLTRGETNNGFNLLGYLGLSRILGVTAAIAGVNVILVTALATLGAFLYNVSTALVGGLHVTLAEDA